MASVEQNTPGTKEEFLRIHRLMAQAKALDDRMHILVKQGRAPFVGSARGHEGIQVGATAALDGPDDWLVPHYRGLGNAVTMGLTAREWMLAVFAKADDPLTAGRNIPGGCFGYRARRVVTVSQVVASWLPKAAGMAYAARLLGKDSVFLCNFGDGATSTGDFHEALNFAGIHKLAVVFVCENNGYAISVPLAKQAGNPDIYLRAPGYGMAGVQGDGADEPAVYAVAREAVRRARAGEGPYRTAEDIAEALDHDPVARFESWLAGRGWLLPNDAAKIHADLEREAGEAADWAEQQPDPRPEDTLRNVFAE